MPLTVYPQLGALPSAYLHLHFHCRLYKCTSAPIQRTVGQNWAGRTEWTDSNTGKPGRNPPVRGMPGLTGNNSQLASLRSLCCETSVEQAVGLSGSPRQ